MELDAILFDYGGTLDGPASHWLDRFVGLYAAAGAPIPIDRLKPAFYAADEAAYADPLVAEMSLGDLLRFHVAVQHERLGIENIRLRQRLIDAFVADTEAALTASRAVLERLAARHRLGVVSNFYGNVGRILADAGFAPLLRVVADSNRVGAMKPDRRIFDHALAALGTAPARTMHVGDSHERDVRAARALGLRTAWLVPADRGMVSDPDADIVISSLASLEDFTTEAQRHGD
ncbi:MAG: HAD family hydrolase [Deltaproteobacteria bacterium]|nr:HAD family hydrolase [Deltaproteobacteria bacterium]